jgi:hypothetical protein
MCAGGAIAREAQSIKYEQIVFVSTDRADCTFSRLGKVVARATLSDNPAGSTVASYVVVPLDSTADLVVVCQRAGYWPEAKVLVYGPNTYISDGMYTSSSWVQMEYPKTIRLDLELRKSK